ncbi:MAG: hypothetical protein HY000_09415 [Planctomycetes bacterium]|nr:hypothetical protein [Planctomycetota bacterium]
MVRYEFQLATREDDAQLRAILAATPMRGRIAVSFRREPSFFDAAVVDGAFHQVVICRDQQQHRIAGFGCRSVRDRFVNGRPTPVGYLSSLRVLPDYRPLGLLARGYAYFRRLHSDQKAQIYLTTIAEDNDRALSTLTTGRAGLPDYAFAGRYHTVVIPIPRRRHRVTSCVALQVREATALDRDCLIAFLQEVGPARQFFPCLRAADFFEEKSTFRDLAPGDLLLAFRDGRLVGTLGSWDQRGFRQSVVESYDRVLGWLRPFYNAWAAITGRPRLVRVGEPLRCLTAAIPTVLENDAAVFATLLDALLVRASAGPADYLLVGLHETDPLLPVAQRRAADSYVTRVYLVSWEDGRSFRDALDDRPRYLELGFL